MILNGVVPATSLQAVEIETTVQCKTVTTEVYETLKFLNRFPKFLMSKGGDSKNFRVLSAYALAGGKTYL